MKTKKQFLKYVITGGSGFIGSNLANYIDNIEECKIFILDKELPPRELSNKVYFKKINILEKVKLKELLLEIKPNYIFHLAARTNLNGNKISDYRVNYEGVNNIIEASKNLKSLKRIIFASSMLVCKLGYIPKDDNDFLPPNKYGLSKVLAEKIIRKSNIKVSWCIVRPTSIWGPGFKIPYSKFFELISQGRYFHIGNSKVYKTYGYIENTCFQLYKLINASKDQIEKKVFYLGDSNNYIIRDWAIEIAKESNSKEIKIIPKLIVFLVAILGSILKKIGINFPMTIFRYKNMTKDNRIDLRKIKTLASQLPYTRIEGTRRTINWMKK